MVKVFFLLLAIVAIVSAQLSGFFSPAELAAKQRTAKQYLSIDPQSAYDAYFSTRILDATKVKSYDCDCEAISSLAKDKQNVDSQIDIYYGVKASEACKCDGKIGVNAKVLEAVKESLKSDELDTYAGAALAAKALGKFVPPKEDAVKKIKMLMQPSGLFKSKKGSASSASIKNTKLAITVLSEFAQGGSELDEVAAAVASLLTDEDNEKVSDPTLLAYLQSLSGKKPVLEKMKGKSGAARMLAIAEGLLAYKYSSCASRVATVIESMIIMQSYKTKPVHIELTDNTFKFGDSIKTEVSVKDIFGKDVTATSIDVKSLKKEDRDKDLFSGSLTAGALDLSKIKADITPGRFVAELAIMLPERTKSLTHQALFLVQAQLDVLDVSAGVSDSKTSTASDLREIATQNAWAGDEASTNTKNGYVHVAFTVGTPVKTGARFQKPHQVFVKFTHKESGTHSFFVAGADGAYNGNKKYKGFGSKYRTTIAINKEKETFYHLSGEYTVSILVADASADGQEWVVGDVEIELPQKDNKHSSLYKKALLDVSDNTLKALPELQHLMRPPPKTAPPVISVTFALLALIPLIAFVGFVLSLKPDLKRMSSTTSILFASGVTGTCILYGSYWLGVPGCDFYSTIKYLIFGFPLLVVVGRGSVSSVIAERTMEDEKNKKLK